MTESSESGSPGLVFGLAAGLAVFLLAGSVVLAQLGRIGLTGAGPGDAAIVRTWAALALVTAGCSFLDGLIAALFLAVPSRRTWSGTLVTSVAALLASLGVGASACCGSPMRVGEAATSERSVLLRPRSSESSDRSR